MKARLLLEKIRQLEWNLGIEHLSLNILPINSRTRLKCLKRYLKDLEKQAAIYG